MNRTAVMTLLFCGAATLGYAQTQPQQVTAPPASSGQNMSTQAQAKPRPTIQTGPRQPAAQPVTNGVSVQQAQAAATQARPATTVHQATTVAPASRQRTQTNTMKTKVETKK